MTATGAQNSAPLLSEAPHRTIRVSRERVRAEVFCDDWHSLTDTERHERLRTLLAEGGEQG